MRFLEASDNIPAETWFEVIMPLLREGHQLKICPQGQSMVPFLRGGRDEAIMSAPDGGHTFKKNDVVLFKFDSGMHVLHRISRIMRNGDIFTLGDNNATEDGPFKREEILCVVDYIIRKGKTIRNKDRKYIFLVTLWRFIRPIRPLVIKGYASIKRLESKARNVEGDL